MWIVLGTLRGMVVRSVFLTRVALTWAPLRSLLVNTESRIGIRIVPVVVECRLTVRDNLVGGNVAVRDRCARAGHQCFEATYSQRT